MDKPLHELVQEAATKLLTPEMVETKVMAAMEKLVESAIDEHFRSYGDIGKQVSKNIRDQLGVPEIELAPYSGQMLNMLKARMDAITSEIVSERMKELVDDIAGKAPKEITTNEIVAKLLEQAVDNNYDEGTATKISCHIDSSGSQLVFMYLDEDPGKLNYECRYRLVIDRVEQQITGLEIGRQQPNRQSYGRYYSFDHLLQALWATGAKVTVSDNEPVTLDDPYDY